MSFPPDARRCMHCGGRLGKAATAREVRFEPAEAPDEDEEPSSGPPRLLRTGLGSVWILMALAYTCQRVCSGG